MGKLDNSNRIFPFLNLCSSMRPETWYFVPNFAKIFPDWEAKFPQFILVTTVTKKIGNILNNLLGWQTSMLSLLMNRYFQQYSLYFLVLYFEMECNNAFVECMTKTKSSHIFNLLYLTSTVLRLVSVFPGNVMKILLRQNQPEDFLKYIQDRE